MSTAKCQVCDASFKPQSESHVTCMKKVLAEAEADLLTISQELGVPKREP